MAAAANLRAAVYGIPQQNLFEAKGMAGNIIHAIATTNAAIAGLIVIEALKILSGNSDRCKVVLFTDDSETRTVERLNCWRVSWESLTAPLYR